MLQWPANTALRYNINGLLRMSYAIPPPWSSCKVLSTAQSSPYGWVMNQWTTTQIYLHASLELKERALEKTTPINGYPGSFRPDDELMAFLKGL